VTNGVSQQDLGRIHIFDQIDFSQLGQFIPQFEKIHLASGETLLSPTQHNQSIFGLLEGELLICLQPDDARAIAHVQAGDCVGEISIIDDRPPSAYVVASGDCVLVSIDRDLLTQMFEYQPRLAVTLLKVLGNRFRSNTDILLNSLELQEEYRNKAEQDGLTGLWNRNWMNEVFPRQLELSERIGQKVSAVMIDADHFKQVNDTYGHQVGDQALIFLARHIGSNLRETDLLVRFGGEEMLALMPGTGIERAQVVAERLRTIIASTPLEIESAQPIALSVSIGLSEWRVGESVDNLIGRADKALYESKKNGRNRVSVIR
jgi:diguanylate cyclase (GGDEF)-like protein